MRVRNHRARRETRQEVSPLQFLAWWRTTAVRDREIIDGVVQAEHQGPSPELRRALAEWPGTHYWAHSDGPGRLVLVRPLEKPRPERWWLHTLLFLLTFVTVWMGGALLFGASPGPGAAVAPGVSVTSVIVHRWLGELATRGVGFDFAMALMAILLAHESGHYLVAKRYGVNVSPPFFLPAPPQLNFIGTFGAFIRLRSPIIDRRQLLDVGAAGPWAGFFVALVALIVGLSRSQVIASGGTDHLLLSGGLALGDSPIVWGIRRWLLDDGTVVVHPLAFAGWLGMFITMLNLMPLGQLDGGHVLYAIIGRWQRGLARLVWWGLVALGVYAARDSLLQGLVWWVWAVLLLLLGRGRLSHPEVLDRIRPLPARRQPLAWATLLLFAATFTPVPIHYL